jgi:hypothetical protein
MITTSMSTETLHNDLIDMINSEIDAYGSYSGWKKFSATELDAIVTRYITEVTDDEINEYYDNDDDEYGDREGAIMCYLNEWVDNDDLINF